MLALVLLLLLIWFVLMGFLFAWTLWFQGYIYTEPVSKLHWRAPAAGTALTFFLLLWIFIDYRAVKNAPDAQYPYGPIQELAPPKTDAKPFDVLYVFDDNDKKTAFKREHADDTKNRFVYRNGQFPIPSRPMKVIAVEKSGEETIFEPDHDAKGQFKPQPDKTLLYRDDKGRVLREGTFDIVPSYRFWPFLVGVLLNVCFPAVWFVCLWLLLRYQPWHAVGLAAAFALVLLIFVIPPVMSRAETVARPPPPVHAVE